MSSLLLLMQFAIGMVMPGSYSQFKCERFWGLKSGSDSKSGLLIQVLSISSIYLALQMLVVYSLLQFGVESIAVIVGVKLAMDIVASGCWDREYWSVLLQRIQLFSPWAWQRASQVQLVIGLLFGGAAVLLMPHGLDNSAVGWLASLLDYSVLPLYTSQGAISYISFLAIPSMIMEGLAPVPTVAACMKIGLSLLVALVSRRLVEAVSSQVSRKAFDVGWYALALQLITISTSIGKYGIFDTGKETVFAMLFFFAVAAELILCKTERQSGWCFRVAVVVGASIGFGAMAVPYCLILLATFVLFSWGSINPLRLAAACLLWAFPTVLVSIHAMLDWSWLKSGLAILVPLVGCICLTSWGDRFDRSGALVSRRFGMALALSMFGASILVAAVLMPVQFHMGYYPFDGEAAFYKLAMHYNKFDVVGLLGITCFLLGSQFRRSNAGMMSLLCFPFFCALPALVMANYFDALRIPLHPQNVWDWGKDIPRWISGMHLGVFCIVGWVSITRWPRITRGQRPAIRGAGQWIAAKPARIAAVSAIVILLLIDTRLILKRIKIKGLPTYTSIGGHSDPEFAQFVEWAYLAKCENRFLNYGSRPLIISDSSVAQKWLSILPMYGIRTVAVSDFHQTEIDDVDKYWCLCPDRELLPILYQLEMDGRFRTESVTNVADEQIFKLFSPLLTANRPVSQK